MNELAEKFYDSERIVDTPCKNDIDHWIQYRMHAMDINSGAPEPYLLDFMKWNSLWVTDIYPERWANDENRCKRFTSHEGIFIDFRKISNTSVFLFLRDFTNTNEAMVISGSYQDGEVVTEDSRRLRFYRYFFGKLSESLDFRIVEAHHMNAFFILNPLCTLPDSFFIEEYRRFKNKE